MGCLGFVCLGLLLAVDAASMRPPKLLRLNVGATKPLGWLKQELTLQAKGLSGQLPYFWSYFNKSAWAGGVAGSKPSQFIPYFINGLFPLSYQIDDHNLVAWRERYVEYILAHQTNGWLGPDIEMDKNMSGRDGRNTYWTKYLAVQAFELYAEAIQQSDPQQYQRVYDALLSHLHQFYVQLVSDAPPMNITRWGFARYSEGIVGVQWMIDHQPPGAVAAGNTSFLWDLQRAIRQKSDAIMGAEDHTWEDFYRSGDPYQFPPGEGPSTQDSGTVHLLRHGVDIGEAMKTGALWWRVSGSADDYANPHLAMAWADRFLHMADGMYYADEEVSGPNSPARGTETCSVVETMNSLRVMYEITGNITFMDRLERIAFNSLPAALWPDVTANVYHHASNMIEAVGGPW